MKIRSDFVSNSSSSSFIIKKQDGIIDFFNEFKKIISEIHNVILYFDDDETFTRCINYLIGNTTIKEYFDKEYCFCNLKTRSITLAASLYNNQDEECVHDCVSVTSAVDRIEFFIEDNFDEHSCRLHQLATLAEYKGFDINTDCMEHDSWVQMKDQLNENKN